MQKKNFDIEKSKITFQVQQICMYIAAITSQMKTKT